MPDHELRIFDTTLEFDRLRDYPIVDHTLAVHNAVTIGHAPLENTIQINEDFRVQINDKYTSIQCVVECWECVHRSRIDNQDEYLWCNRCGMEVCRRGFCYLGVKGG